jgi:DNA (cytosine-5)-methyltransferase 1
MDAPPFAIPSLAEIQAVPDNGLSVISTFTGTGGSCLGFRWAGFRTLAACEFVEAARDSYAANFPGVPIEPRDVREVKGSDLLELAGTDEVDVMEGSPPCSAFSTSGKRQAGWGQESKYSDTSQRVDDLFFEFSRLVGEVRPRAFVAENVSGLVKGTAKGYFKRIIADLRAQGYRVGSKVLDAQWLGVPQVRRRVIFVGIRNDLERDPAFPAPLPYRYSVLDALPHLDGLRLQRGTGAAFGHREDLRSSSPIPTVMGRGRSHDFYLHDYVGGGKPGSLADPAPTIQTHGRAHTHSEFTVPAEDKVDLEGYAIAPEYDRLRVGESSDKYQNLIKVDPALPSPTVTAVGGSSPGTASIAHPTERRKFHIWEVRRLCGFPDDFTLTGNYAQQWERLGRAVPPPMMFAVASALAPVLS